MGKKLGAKGNIHNRREQYNRKIAAEKDRPV
jgi:hypothetical protein